MHSTAAAHGLANQQLATLNAQAHVQPRSKRYKRRVRYNDQARAEIHNMYAGEECETNKHTTDAFDGPTVSEISEIVVQPPRMPESVRHCKH